jgi:two-component system response regulator VicR
MSDSAKIPHILFVEDDETLAFVTADSLRAKGFEVSHSANGLEALDIFRENTFDICLLDVMVPGLDGFSLAEKIREIDEHVPVLFLTARSMQEDRIHGLSIGGDDYITKPFSIEELVLRMRIFLKRRNVDTNDPNSNNTFTLGKYTLDHTNLILTCEDDPQKLTLTEADLLKLFFRNKNKILKREDILIAVWGDDSLYLSRSLDVFISRLRKLLSKDKKLILKNMRSVGFALRYKV